MLIGLAVLDLLPSVGHALEIEVIIGKGVAAPGLMGAGAAAAVEKTPRSPPTVRMAAQTASSRGVALTVEVHGLAAPKVLTSATRTS